MCFYTADYDWCASVVEHGTAVATDDGLKRTCLECGEIIKPGATYITIYQQQYESCQTCDPDLDGLPCACDKPDYGETFNYRRCGDCDKFLKVIEHLEEEEGCPPNARQPYLEQLFEELRNTADFSGIRDVKKYVKAALATHPELKAYFRRHWQRMIPCS